MKTDTDLRFDGRVAVVTGAGTGIGAAHAQLLARRGAAVVVNDLNDTDAQAVAQVIEATGGRSIATPADVASERGAAAVVAAAVDSFGRVDIVVNNAGILRSSKFGEMTVELWDHIIAVNLRGTFLVSHAAWPFMVEQGYGRIVSTTSNSGLLGVAESTAYSAAKAAIWGLTRSLSLEGGSLGINVNAIAPLAYTAMSAASKIAPAAWQTGEGDEWSRRLDVRRVAPVVAWLTHENCSLNGQVLSAIGGRIARFSMRVTEGFDVDELTPELVRDHEADLLVDDAGTEYRAALAEGNAIHRRLMRQP